MASVRDQPVRMTSRRLLISVAAAGLLGGAGGAAITHGIEGDGVRTAVPAATATSPISDTGTSTAGAIYDRSKDAVAFITATSQQGTATGTGFAISSDGYLVTNAHVIDGASKVSVKVGDG